MTTRPSVIAALVAGMCFGCDAGPKAGSSTGEATPTGAANAPTPAPEVAPTPAAPKPAAPAMKFGAALALTASTPIEVLLAAPKDHVGKTVRIEGQVVDVCPKRGCWMDLAGPAPGQKLRFKVADGDMVFPVDAKGKYAVAEGVVAVRELTLEETKEYVAYQQREYGAERDPASVTEPMVIVRLDGTGAELRDHR